MSVRFEINDVPVQFSGDPDTALLWVIRDNLGLTGTKYGCGVAQCGACTVHIDGESRRSCVTPISTIAGRHVTTIEGAQDSISRVVKAAWINLDVPQCGFCQSGQVMSAIALLRKNRSPTPEAIDAGMAGNICRCATYGRIRKAIRAAAADLA